MTLQTQIVDIKFDQGVDTRDDGFLRTGNFDEMSNVEIQKAGGIVKRNGFETVFTTGIVGTILKIHEVNESLICVSTDGIYKRNESTLAWTKIGNGPSVNIENYSQVIPNDEIPVGIGESNGKTIIITFKYFQTIMGRGDRYSCYAHELSSDFSSIAKTNKIIATPTPPDVFSINYEYMIEGASVHQTDNGRLVLVCRTVNVGVVAISIYETNFEKYRAVKNSYGATDVFKSSCSVQNSVFVFTSYFHTATSKLRYYVEKLAIGANSITLAASNDRLKGTGSGAIESELTGLSSSCGSSIVALVDQVSGSAASFTIAAIASGYSVKSNGVVGQYEVSVASSKYVGADCTLAIPIIADRVLVSLTWYDRIFANGTQIYYKPANEARIETISYVSAAGTVLITVNFPYWNTGTVTMSIAGQFITGLNIFAISAWLISDLSGGFTDIISPGEPYPENNIKVRSFIHPTYELMIYYSLDKKTTKRIQYSISSGGFSPSYTLYQGVIISQITPDYDAVFYDPSSLSYVQTNLITNKLSAIHNQGNAKSVELSSRESSADSNKVSCLISNSKTLIAPIISDESFFGPYNVIKQSAITSQSLMSIQSTSSVFFTGGFLGEFSLNESAEVGFIQTPRIISTYAYSSGGQLGAGDYYYAFTYSYVSSTGEKSESAPIETDKITTTGAGTSAIEIRVSPLTFTLRDLTKCFLNVYRTKKGESVKYKVTSIQMGGQNDIFYYDSIADSYLTNKEILYTTGGIFSNSAIGSCFSICATKNRVLVASSENKVKVFYSKEKLTGYGFEFCGLQFIDCDGGQFEGPITSIFGMDEKIIIAKDRYLLGVYGDGPNAAGGGSDFSIPQLISTDVGVSDKNSVVTIPIGVMFKSNKGIYLISRGLAVSYIGILADKYAQETILSSAMHPKKNLVFFGISGKIIVYDYLLEKWFIWKGALARIDSLSSCFVSGNLYILPSTGTIISKQNSSYVDQYASPGYFENIITEIETSWLELGSINGFQRLRRIMFLGHAHGSIGLDIKVMRDYDTTVLETHNLAISASSGKVQTNMHLANQKSATTKINIKESGTGTPNKLSLSGMSYEIGIKKGVSKVSASNKI